MDTRHVGVPPLSLAHICPWKGDPIAGPCQMGPHHTHFCTCLRPYFRLVSRWEHLLFKPGPWLPPDCREGGKTGVSPQGGRDLNRGAQTEGSRWQPGKEDKWPNTWACPSPLHRPLPHPAPPARVPPAPLRGPHPAASLTPFLWFLELLASCDWHQDALRRPHLHNRFLGLVGWGCQQTTGCAFPVALDSGWGRGPPSMKSQNQIEKYKLLNELLSGGLWETFPSSRRSRTDKWDPSCVLA